MVKAEYRNLDNSCMHFYSILIICTKTINSLFSINAKFTKYISIALTSLQVELLYLSSIDQDFFHFLPKVVNIDVASDVRIKKLVIFLYIISQKKQISDIRDIIVYINCIPVTVK